MDPHLVKQVIHASLEDLQNKYTKPFGPANQYPCLMTAHATYTALDKENISTYSSAFYRFTKKALNYDGLIIPDALNMQAADGHSPQTVGWRMNKALEAGADVVMPFFDYSADPKWKEEQLRQIRPQYIKRFQKKVKLIQRKSPRAFRSTISATRFPPTSPSTARKTFSTIATAIPIPR